MNGMNEVRLSGCTPEPLMSYLKALGVFRLVAEQKDGNAKGCWMNGEFILRSSLDARQLVEFFLHEYKPTPIVFHGRRGLLRVDKKVTRAFSENNRLLRELSRPFFRQEPETC